MPDIEDGIEFARSLDRDDKLGQFRGRYVIDDPGLIYVDGNSLGRLPKTSVKLSEDLILEQWGKRLIRGWGEGWYTSPERVGAKIAQIIGADPDEVIVADSTSLNLFKLAAAGLSYQQGRKKIITDDLNFPSDLYVLQGTADLLGCDHRLVVCQSEDGIYGPVKELKAALDSETAIMALSHVVFKSGYLYDLSEITESAHQAGAFVLWDLSHSVGAVPIDLHAAGVDLAVGCTYKYLNGGPGAPAFLFVRRELHRELANPIPGWMGSDDAFDFNLNYQPAPGIRRFLSGTPAVISLALIEAGVDLLIEAGMEAVREKSCNQVMYLVDLFTKRLAPLGFRLNSPVEPAKRGSHISIAHPEGLRINKALIADMRVLPDFRAPDNIRLGIASMYTRFTDLYHLVDRIGRVVEEGLYKKYSPQRPTVT